MQIIEIDLITSDGILTNKTGWICYKIKCMLSRAVWTNRYYKYIASLIVLLLHISMKMPIVPITSEKAKQRLYHVNTNIVRQL